MIEAIKESGRNVSVQRDYMLQDSDFSKIDLVCSLGGDGTFLKTASMIKSNRLPICGINTDPTRSVGHLNSMPIHYRNKTKEVSRFISYLDH